jgi:hypothetical protein
MEGLTAHLLRGLATLVVLLLALPCHSRAEVSIPVDTAVVRQIDAGAVTHHDARCASERQLASPCAT